MTRSRLAIAGALLLVAALAVVLSFGCAAGPAPEPVIVAVPDPDTGSMEPRVAQRFAKAREEVLAAPESPAAWGHFGAVSHAHELYEVAEPCYRRAAELDPADFRWPYLQGIVLEVQGASPEQILERFEEAESLEPGFPLIPLRLGDALMRLGRLDEAHEAYSRSAELDPTLAVARRGLGQVLVALGRPEEALEQLERALASGGEDDKVYAAMAQAEARLGRMDRADAAAEKSRTVKRSLPVPDPVRYQVGTLGISARHCYERARKLMSAGQFDQAISQLEIAEEIDPDNSDVQYRLGACFARTGPPGAAIDHLERALTRNPEHAGAHAELGRLLVREGKSAEALPHLEAFVRLQPDSPLGHWFLGQQLEKVGRDEEARRHYQRAVELDPKSPAAERL